MSSCFFCRYMDESGNHHSQQTDKNRKPNTTWTQGGEHHTRASQGLGGTGGIALGEIPNVDDGLMDATNHHGTYIPM